MYKVAVCEDEEVFLQAHTDICRQTLDKLNIGYQITEFDSSANFLDALMQNQSFDLILLDILMDGTTGVELAKMIRQTDQEAVIIFISSSQDHVFEGYDVNALHYLTKPVDAAKLESLICSAYENRFQSNYLLFKSGASYQKIALRDIISLETVGRKVEITLPDRSLFFPGKLTELLAELPKDSFVRCHQAYAINLRNIQELARYEAIAPNGRAIPISRKYQKEVQKAFLRNMQEEAK